jgi:hypothetical protein
MRTTLIAILTLILGAAGTRSGLAQDTQSVVLRAMQDELQRNIGRLTLEGVSAPFFISYQVKELRSVSIQATAGAITRVDTSRSRQHDVRVLVGDYAQTQEHFSSADFGFSFDSFNATLPIEDDYDAIRRELWLSTDRAYKAQSEKLEKKRAALRQQQLPEEMVDVEDFARAEPVVSIETGTFAGCDIPAWKDRIRALSALCIDHADIHSSNVEFAYHEMTVSFVNSEGTVVVVPRSLAVISATASTQAEEGEPLMDFLQYHARTPDGLPDIDALAEEMRTMTATLVARRTAVAMEGSYTGPVLFEDQAVAELVTRLYLGDEGLKAWRTPILDGPLAMMGSRMQKRNLRDKIGKRVLPREWSMISVPRMMEFDGLQLTGGFGIDAEGVRPADRLALVDAGAVSSLITDRTPTPGFPSSTGHRGIGVGRAAGDGLSPGVLEITVTDGPRSGEMKKLLLEKAEEEDLDHAYIIRRIRPDAVSAASTGEEMSFSMFGMERNVATPLGDALRIYRVRVADGEEIPVRNVEILKPGASALRGLTACADRRAWNGMLEGSGPLGSLRAFIRIGSSLAGSGSGVPVSIIAPRAVIVDDMEVREEKRPLTPRPPIVQSPLAK